MKIGALVLTCFVILSLCGCLAIQDKTVNLLADKMIKDLNSALSDQTQEGVFIDTYIYITQGATVTDADHYGTKLFDYITSTASSVEFVSVTGTALKNVPIFDFANPPSWIGKVYDILVHYKTAVEVKPGVLPGLLIGNRLYLLTVYVQEDKTLVYPRSAVFDAN